MKEPHLHFHPPQPTHPEKDDRRALSIWSSLRYGRWRWHPLRSYPGENFLRFISLAALRLAWCVWAGTGRQTMQTKVTMGAMWSILRFSFLRSNISIGAFREGSALVLVIPASGGCRKGYVNSARIMSDVEVKSWQ